MLTPKPVKFSDLPLPSVFSRLFKKELNKSKYYNKNKSPLNNLGRKEEHIYTQALTGNVKDIFKLKENFSQLSSKNIEDIHKIMNNTGKLKLQINMTTKDPS